MGYVLRHPHRSAFQAVAPSGSANAHPTGQYALAGLASPLFAINLQESRFMKNDITGRAGGVESQPLSKHVQRFVDAQARVGRRAGGT